VRNPPAPGEPILYAPDRAGRPNAFERANAEICPFCPGNESLTPPEIARTGDPWRVRVFPNKYPAVEGHEVIVESSHHDATFESIDNAAEVVSMYISRYRAHASAAYVSLFTNAGERAGASIDHIHSQLMPVPFIPPRIERHLTAFASGPCPLCRNVGTTIEENDSFARVVPEAAQQTYQQWIVPKRHEPDFTSLRDAEVVSLAAMLRIDADRNISVDRLELDLSDDRGMRVALRAPAEAARATRGGNPRKNPRRGHPWPRSGAGPAHHQHLSARDG